MTNRPDTQFLLISLREDIDRLTLPYKQTIVQEVGESEIAVEKREILFKPLFTQLQDAIGSSQSVAARGGGDMSTRSVLDASALMLMADIEDDLRSLWNLVFAPVRRARPVENIRSVRQLMIQINRLVMDDRLDEEELWKIKHIVHAWVTQIDAKFDPPVLIEVTRPCPHCQESFVYDEFNDRILALVVEWRKSFESSSAECRACGYTWLGQTELRQMRWELDQMDVELDLSGHDTPDTDE